MTTFLLRVERMAFQHSIELGLGNFSSFIFLVEEKSVITTFTLAQYLAADLFGTFIFHVLVVPFEAK